MGKETNSINYSCPYLDSVIDGLKEAVKYLEGLDNTDAKDIASTLFYLYNGSRSDIEKARKIHDTLRCLCGDFEDEVTNLKEEIESLTNLKHH